MNRMTGRSVYQLLSITLLIAWIAVSLVGCTEEEPRHNNLPVSLWMQRITKSDNVRSVDQAIEAVIAIGQPAVPYLIKGWKKNDSIEVRCRIASALEGIGPDAAAAVPLLINALNAIEEQMVSCAAYALGGIGQAAEPAAEKLGNLLRSSDSTTQINLLYALGAIGPAAADQIPLILEAVERERTRSAAIDALSQMGPPAVDAVQTWLEDGSREQKLGALHVLANAGGSDQLSTVLPQLTALMKDSDPLVRGAAVRAIGRAKTAAAPAEADLIDMLNDRDADVRRDVIQALMNIGPDAGGTKLIEALDDSRPRVREGAARVIGRYQTLVQRSQAKLIQRMGDSDVNSRVAAIEALTTLGPEIIPTMIRQLQSSNMYMRFGAARVLGSHGKAAQDALPALRKMLNDKDALLQNEARSAISKIQ